MTILPPLRGGTNNRTVSGGIARGLAQPPATFSQTCGLKTILAPKFQICFGWNLVRDFIGYLIADFQVIPPRSLGLTRFHLSNSAHINPFNSFTFLPYLDAQLLRRWSYLHFLHLSPRPADP